jgi:transporter family-2 protein
MRTVSADPAVVAIYSEAAARAGEVEGRQMSDVTSIVFVVDDDVSVRESLELLIRAAGWQPETFASALEFLSRPRPTVPCCLVLDVTLPGLSGLELQQQLADRTDMPIIFITGHGDVPMTVQAMKHHGRQTRPATRAKDLTRGFRVSSLDFVLLGALAVIVGALIPVQAATNAAMSRVTGSVVITSLALFAIGFVVVAAWAIVVRVPLPSLETLRHVPAYGYLGGFIVAGYVISITFLAPRLGVGNAIRLVVTGQIVAAVIIDHVGAFGAVTQRLTTGRAIGVVLMIIGVILCRR